MAEGYRTARGVIGFIAFLGWIVAVIGAVLAVLPLISDGSLTTIGIGVLIVAAGLFLVAGAQMSYAVLDTADSAREIAEDLRQIRAEGAMAAPPARAAPAPAGGRAEPVLTRGGGRAEQKGPDLPRSFADRGERKVVRVMDEEIVHEDDLWHAMGRTFDTLGEAKAAVKAERGEG